MGSLHKKIKKYSPMANIERSVLGKETFDQLHPLGTQAEVAYDTAKASKKALKDAQDPTKNPVIPLPDEEALERERRRRAAKRTGGRASTVLTDEDRMGG